MESGYILLACGFVGIAIAISAWQNPATFRRMISVRHWLTKDLVRGDFHALSAAGRGREFDLDIDQIKRLRQRGYMRKALLGGFTVTLKGRCALALRWAIGKDRLAMSPAAVRQRGSSPNDGAEPR